MMIHDCPHSSLVLSVVESCSAASSNPFGFTAADLCLGCHRAGSRLCLPLHIAKKNPGRPGYIPRADLWETGACAASPTSNLCVSARTLLRIQTRHLRLYETRKARSDLSLSVLRRRSWTHPCRSVFHETLNDHHGFGFGFCTNSIREWLATRMRNFFLSTTASIITIGLHSLLDFGNINPDETARAWILIGAAVSHHRHSISLCRDTICGLAPCSPPPQPPKPQETLFSCNPIRSCSRLRVGLAVEGLHSHVVVDALYVNTSLFDLQQS